MTATTSPYTIREHAGQWAVELEVETEPAGRVYAIVRAGLPSEADARELASVLARRTSWTARPCPACDSHWVRGGACAACGAWR